MTKIIKSEERGHKDYGWLETYHSFSFSDYYDPEKIHFGPIRVLNHDYIQGGQGFPTHPHKDMEIVTIMINGELAHKDSTGKEEVIRPNEVQKMSAGRGVFHSEYNHSSTEIAELLQIWIIPDKQGIEPSYEQIRFSPEERKNNLLKIAGNQKEEGKIFINQRLELFLSDLERDKIIGYNLSDGKGVYIYLIGGELKVNENRISAGDAVQIENENEIKVTATQDSSFILFDVALN